MITALWVVGILALLAVNLAYRVRLDLALTDYRADNLEARVLLESGLARALWAVRQDQTPFLDHLGEEWATAPDMKEENLIPARYAEQDPLAIRWSIVDENRKVNLNTAHPRVVKQLLRAYHADEDTDPDLLGDYICDWRDRDQVGGAEEFFYRMLKPPYQPRDNDFESIEELLAVRDISRRLLYGEDWNGNGEVDPEEDDGARRPPDDNADGALQFGLADILTVASDNSLNVNTVPRMTLAAVFEAFVDAETAQHLVGEIMQLRSGPDETPGTADDTPLVSTVQVAEVIGETLYQQCKSAGVPLGVCSSEFTVNVFVCLEKERLQKAAIGTISRSPYEARVTSWRLR